MFKALFPLAFVPVAVLPLMNAVSFGLGVTPLAYVRVAPVGTGPHAMAVLEPALPLSIVDLAVDPLVDAFPVRLAIPEGTEIGVVVGVALETTAISSVLQPFPLVLATVRVAHHSHAVPQNFFIVLFAKG